MVVYLVTVGVDDLVIDYLKSVISSENYEIALNKVVLARQVVW